MDEGVELVRVESLLNRSINYSAGVTSRMIGAFGRQGDRIASNQIDNLLLIEDLWYSVTCTQ